jgi:hypothetical protein
MSQPVSPQPQSVEAWVSSWQVLVDFVDKIGTGTVLSPSTLVSFATIIPPKPHTHAFIPQ